jgi:hypothetical protein
VYVDGRKMRYVRATPEDVTEPAVDVARGNGEFFPHPEEGVVADTQQNTKKRI